MTRLYNLLLFRLYNAFIVFHILNMENPNFGIIYFSKMVNMSYTLYLGPDNIRSSVYYLLFIKDNKYEDPVLILIPHFFYKMCIN